MAMVQATQDRLRSSFHDLALEQILSSDEWARALHRPNARIPAQFAWEGESTRLGLLMNLFCFPDAWESEGLTALIGCRCHRPKFFVTLR